MGNESWDILEQRLKNLLMDYRKVQADALALQEKNLLLSKELDAANRELTTLREARRTTSEASALREALGGKNEAVQKIDVLLREIDQCIAQLQ